MTRKLSVLLSLFTVAAILIGCGGTSTPPAPTVADASGAWSGHLTSTATKSDPTVHTSTTNISITQGSTDAATSTASLTATMTIDSPDCPAVSTGTGPAATGTGTIVGHRISLTFTLPDGGSLVISGGDSDTATPGHLFQASYQFASGTCSPQFGTPSLDKQ